MRVIDSHVHLYPADVNHDPVSWAVAHRESHWAGLCTRRRKNGGAVQHFPSVAELLAEMDTAGVERAVLLGWYWQHSATCEHQNRFYAECIRAHADRLSAFATIQPLAGVQVTVDEMRRARDDGLVGLGELSPHSQEYGIDDPSFAAALQLAAEFGWPVNVHVTDPNSRPYPGQVETPLEDFVQLARDFPQVNFILAHWGGLLPLRGGAAIELRNLFYDTAASPLMYDDSVWRRFLASVTPDRVLFGSDFPLNLYPNADPSSAMTRFLQEARDAEMPDEVLSGNAARLLRI